jgi:hypothetical protein
MRVVFKGVDAHGKPMYDLGFQQVVDVLPGPTFKATGG